MTKHVPKYTSIDLTYDILGKAAFVDDISVVIVNTVVTPSETLAGVAFRLSQNDTHLSNKAIMAIKNWKGGSHNHIISKYTSNTQKYINTYGN